MTTRKILEIPKINNDVQLECDTTSSLWPTKRWFWALYFDLGAYPEVVRNVEIEIDITCYCQNKRSWWESLATNVNAPDFGTSNDEPSGDADESFPDDRCTRNDYCVPEEPPP